jgi:hypothetical protein
MKKTLVFILISLAVIAFAMTSCVDNTIPKPMVKPFIIIGKTTTTSYEAMFTYQDAEGKQVQFRDYINKYSVGDTLK